MDSFKFELGERVTIVASHERGEIVGRAEYQTSARDYLIRYKNGAGIAVQQWWTESALDRAESR
jgi:hypothetical protein